MKNRIYDALSTGLRDRGYLLERVDLSEQVPVRALLGCVTSGPYGSLGSTRVGIMVTEDCTIHATLRLRGVTKDTAQLIARTPAPPRGRWQLLDSRTRLDSRTCPVEYTLSKTYISGGATPMGIANYIGSLLDATIHLAALDALGSSQ